MIKNNLLFTYLGIIEEKKKDYTIIKTIVFFPVDNGCLNYLNFLLPEEFKNYIYTVDHTKSVKYFYSQYYLLG